MSETLARINEKVCVILGAGASKDAWKNGGPLRKVEWQPPLANELFQFGKRTVFWQVATHYPGVRVLASELAEAVEAGTATLEAKLLEYSTHPDQRVRDHFKQVPPYLRDLLVESNLALAQSADDSVEHCRDITNGTGLSTCTGRPSDPRCRVQELVALSRVQS